VTAGTILETVGGNYMRTKKWVAAMVATAAVSTGVGAVTMPQAAFAVTCSAYPEEPNGAFADCSTPLHVKVYVVVYCRRAANGVEYYNEGPKVRADDINARSYAYCSPGDRRTDYKYKIA
jgi:hypothetical protein